MVAGRSGSNLRAVMGLLRLRRPEREDEETHSRGQWRVATSSVPDSLRSCHWSRHQSLLCNTEGKRTHTHTQSERSSNENNKHINKNVTLWSRQRDRIAVSPLRWARGSFSQSPIHTLGLLSGPFSCTTYRRLISKLWEQKEPWRIKHSTYLKPSALGWLRIYINSPARRELWFRQVDAHNYFVF